MYKATKQDIECSKKIIKELCEKNKKNISDSELGKLTEEALTISYSIGGGYDEETIRKIAESYIKRNILQ